jgi:hypothetical protein
MITTRCTHPAVVATLNADVSPQVADTIGAKLEQAVQMQPWRVATMGNRVTLTFPECSWCRRRWWNIRAPRIR